MKKVISGILLAAFAIVANAGILTAGTSTPFTSIELNADFTFSSGPDYDYTWIPDGETRLISADSDGEIAYTGPGWFVVAYDANWDILVPKAFYPNQYSIDTICDVPLVYFYFSDVGSLDFSSDGFPAFLIEWESRGGTYAPCEPPAPMIQKRGKRLGHSK